MERELLVLKGLLENINQQGATLKIGDKKSAVPNITYEEGLHTIGKEFLAIAEKKEYFLGIGHRVVHGGPHFLGPTLVTKSTLRKLNDCIDLAPLHNPRNILGIEMMQKEFPGLPQVAVFDTSFHQTMPKAARLYPLPYSYYEKHQIQRYGFHGISHEFLSREFANKLEKPLSECSLITAHLGNGCSITAIEKGKCVETSMGFTPLEGLMMGTRTGNIDPTLVKTISEIENCSVEDVLSILNKKSGLLGVSGLSNDMRILHKGISEKNPRAELAFSMFAHRIVKTIGAYRTLLSHFDGLVFAGGIGENDPILRQAVTEKLKFLGIFLDSYQNECHGVKQGGLISGHKAPGVWVIPTDEEKMIAQKCHEIVARDCSS